MGIVTREPNHARKRSGARWRRRSLLVLALAAAACGSAESPRPAVVSGELEFQGSWNAAGSRHTISLGEETHPIRIADESYLAIVMPIRLKEGEIP